MLDSDSGVVRERAIVQSKIANPFDLIPRGDLCNRASLVVESRLGSFRIVDRCDLAGARVFERRRIHVVSNRDRSPWRRDRVRPSR
jgi:hypothetical protein